MMPKEKSKKTLERSLVIILIVGGILALFLYGNVIERVTESLVPKEQVFGVWVEQGVAPYAARKISIGPEGVVMQGRVFTTHFKFNGRYLEFQVAEQHYKFKMLNEENTEMRLVSAAHYNPVFHLSENN